MPVITVELVGEAPAAPSGLAQSLADAIGRALRSRPGQTWVRVRWATPDSYAENQSSLADGALPVFVRVLKRQIPLEADLEAEVAVLTRCIAQAVARPASSVHIEYAAPALGRVSFGGRLVK